MKNKHSYLIEPETIIDKFFTQVNIFQVIFHRHQYFKEMIKELKKHPVVNNNFFYFITHTLRDSIILDLNKLLCVPSYKENSPISFSNVSFRSYFNKNQHHNFYLFIQEIQWYIPTEYYNEIKLLLDSNMEDIKILHTERDQNIAHKDFETGSAIHYHMPNIDVIQSLVQVANDVLTLIGKSINLEFGIYDKSFEGYYIFRDIMRDHYDDYKRKRHKGRVPFLEDQTYSKSIRRSLAYNRAAINKIGEYDKSEYNHHQRNIQIGRQHWSKFQKDFRSESIEIWYDHNIKQFECVNDVDSPIVEVTLRHLNNDIYKYSIGELDVK